MTERIQATDRRCQEWVREIVRRGGETEIVGRYGSEKLTCTDQRRVGRHWLGVLRAEGWRQYSRRFGARRAALCYVCGRDDNGPWATRIPATITTIREALDWLEPVEVKRARCRGLRVWRQGEWYVAESRTARGAVDDDGKGYVSLDIHHTWWPRVRMLTHAPDSDGPSREVAHAPLVLPGDVHHVTIVRQRRMENVRRRVHD